MGKRTMRDDEVEQRDVIKPRYTKRRKRCAKIKEKGKKETKKTCASASEPRVKRTVRFSEDVKKNDGLSAPSRIFESILFACCLHKRPVTARNLLVYLERNDELEHLKAIEELVEDAIIRLEDAILRRVGPKHVPFLKCGGGKGFGFMASDVSNLSATKSMIAEARVLLSKYKRFVESQEETSKSDTLSVEKDTSISPSPVSVLQDVDRVPTPLVI